MRTFVVVIFFEGLATILASKPRSVNVALETVLEFDNKDDIDFIDTMQKFLNKLKSTITENRAANNQASNRLKYHNVDPEKQLVFTDFLAETISVLKSYNDEDLKKFFRTLDREIKTWQTRKEFNKITDKLGFRRLIDRKLQNIKNSPANEIRQTLNTLSDNLNFSKRNGNNGLIANFLNYLYKKESEVKLLNILNNLKLYRSRARRNNVVDLKRIIQYGILTIFDPFLKLNEINNTNSIYHEYIANHSNPKKFEKYFMKHIKNNKHKISRQIDKFHNGLKENKILDYIEDHQKVIDNHVTTIALVIKAKLPEKKKFIPVGTTYKYIRSTRPKKNIKLKTKPNRIRKESFESRERENQKKIVKNNKKAPGDDKKDNRPVLISLTNTDDSELKSVKEYLSSKSRRPANKKLYKKSTHSKLTTKKRNIYFKTTKKSRKAFRTTTLSVEGLSIEHFGSLFGREFHRKENDKDTFIQTASHDFESATPNNVTFVKDRSYGFSKETRRREELSAGKNEHIIKNVNETKTLPESFEEKTIDTEIDNKQKDVITESLNIKGNIIIEKPSLVTTGNEIEITTLKPIKNFTRSSRYNVSIVTKYFDLKPMNPTIILRHQDRNINTTSNETHIPPKVFSILPTTLSTVPTTNVSVNQSEVDKIKPIEDGLENEIEGIMDKYNATTIPVVIEKFLKEVNMMNDDNKKVKDQMNADMAKLLAPPTTKSTVTDLFTDPFNDIDDAADII